ncbi:MAG TPA: hypothetical protein VKT78_09870, partial [Fimbriimonadaceae bacterium]|nr:hypothetical protein [Fimbriimonadaceae bacterium]
MTAPTATLTQGSSSYGNDLGTSVALSADGTTAVVGANGVNSNAGAAYLFQVPAENAWATSSAPTATLTNDSGSSGDQLGSSAALSADGTVALLGAYQASGGAGGAYVFSPPVHSYTLTTATNGSGVGAVTSADGSINCGSTCMATYGNGAHVTLYAQPGLNSAFAG